MKKFSCIAYKAFFFIFSFFWFLVFFLCYTCVSAVKAMFLQIQADDRYELNSPGSAISFLNAHSLTSPFVAISSPPARWGLLDFITVVLLLLLLLFLLLVLHLLLHHLCIHFHVHFRLANSSPTSAHSVHCWTSTAGLWSEWARLGLNRKVLSAVGTAGPQPGTFRAQWAPLDLNLGPSELSGHHWTSTWDLPSSVGTAGPQRPARMPEDMPHRKPERMSDRMPEDMPDKVPEDMPDRMPEDMPDKMPEDMPDRMPKGMPDKVPECLPDRIW